jgi:hypothetical protein
VSDVEVHGHTAVLAWGRRGIHDPAASEWCGDRAGGQFRRCEITGAGRTALDVRGVERTCVVLIGGKPFAEPILMWWNFVARSRAEIDRAHAHWQAGAERGSVGWTRRCRVSPHRRSSGRAAATPALCHPLVADSAGDAGDEHGRRSHRASASRWYRNSIKSDRARLVVRAAARPAGGAAAATVWLAITPERRPGDSQLARRAQPDRLTGGTLAQPAQGGFSLHALRCPPRT